MKLTKQQLKQIIKEELKSIKEVDSSQNDDFPTEHKDFFVNVFRQFSHSYVQLMKDMEVLGFNCGRFELRTAEEILFDYQNTATTIFGTKIPELAVRKFNHGFEIGRKESGKKSE